MLRRWTTRPPSYTTVSRNGCEGPRSSVWTWYTAFPTRTFVLKPKFMRRATQFLSPLVKSPCRAETNVLTDSFGAFDRLPLHRYYSLCADDRKRPPKLRATFSTPGPGDGAFRCHPSAFLGRWLAAAFPGKSAGLRMRNEPHGRCAAALFREVLLSCDGLYFV